MTKTIHIGDLSIQVTKKDIKNVHLSVHPPDGRVTLVAPTATRLDAARLNTELVKKPKEMLEYVIFQEGSICVKYGEYDSLPPTC